MEEESDARSSLPRSIPYVVWAADPETEEGGIDDIRPIRSRKPNPQYNHKLKYAIDIRKYWKSMYGVGPAPMSMSAAQGMRKF